MPLHETQFPRTVELMQKHMFEQAAESLKQAIAQYRQNGAECVQAVLGELNTLLAGNIPEAQLTQFVEEHSDYLVAGNGRATLQLIRDVLKE